MPGVFGWTVHYARASDLASAGFEHLEHLPFLRDASLEYATQPNRFLIDRALGVWNPRDRGEKRPEGKSGVPIPPARETIAGMQRGPIVGGGPLPAAAH